MTQIKDLFSELQLIQSIIESYRLDGAVADVTASNMSSKTPIAIQKLTIAINAVSRILGNIRRRLDPIKIDILYKLGFGNLIGPDYSVYLNNKLDAILKDSSSSQFNILAKELDNLVTHPFELMTTLTNFIEKSSVSFTNDEVIIEVGFTGYVHIDDFKDAKKQMADWELITKSYGILLGINASEFQIIDISKNSPTKFKIKTTLKNATLVITLSTALLMLKKEYYDFLIAKQTFENLAPNLPKGEDTVISTLTELHEKDKVEKLSKIAKENATIEIDAQSEATVISGLNKQLNFVVKGGTLNFYSLEGDFHDKIQIYNTKNSDVKSIEDAKILGQIAPDSLNIDIDE